MAALQSFTVAKTPEEIRVACTATIADYAAVAEGYAAGNLDHDISQNRKAVLRGRPGPLDVLDLGCAGGRDVVAFAWQVFPLRKTPSAPV